MNLAEIKPVDIIMHIEQNFNRAQATGLNSLIFLSLREETTVAYQLKEWGFDDIPEQVAAWCDSLHENDLIELATEIATSILEELVTTLRGSENAQSIAQQPIEPKADTPLLSDY